MKKYPAQLLKVAGDLRRPPAKFENPVYRIISPFIIWLAPRAGKMNQRSGQPAVSRKQISPKAIQ